jgi:tetratricopeptide (TPR) repeat protein
VYRHHAQTAISRQLAQEASFKAALLSYLAGDENEAVELLQLTRRNFRSGPLQNEVLALTVEALPKSMRRLLNNQQDIEAISQAQQNRDLFHNGWIDSSLLYELGLAFERLNLGDEAFAVFLYLYNLQTFGDDEELLSSLTRLAHAREDVGLVDDFGEQYLSRYPAGRYRLDVLYYLIDSNFSDGQTELAARLLPEELPDRKDFKILAAAIGLSQGRHEEVTEILSPLYEKEDLPLTSRFMLAESLFALGRVDLSEEIYRELADTGDFRDTSLYRLSVIARRNDNEPQSRALLERLRTETGSSQWLQFVKQEIRLRQLVSQL